VEEGAAALVEMEGPFPSTVAVVVPASQTLSSGSFDPTGLLLFLALRHLQTHKSIGQLGHCLFILVFALNILL
jgi:hypothetical protein